MSEEGNTMVQYKYEDDDAYLTEKGELILKETEFTDRRKIDDLEESLEDGEAQTVIEQYKKEFESLREKVDELLGEEELTGEAIDEMEDMLRSAEAIGDYEELFSQLSQARDRIAEITEESNGEEDEPAGREYTGESGGEEVDEEENPVEFYRKIVDKAENLAKQNDWPYVTMELDNLSHQWEEGPDTGQKEKVSELYEQFQEATEEFEQRKKEHYQEQKKQRHENLEKKQGVLDELETIVEQEEWDAIQKVKKLKSRWNNIGMLPSGEEEKLDEKFNKLLDRFDEHKVDRLVHQRQKEEDNLTGKLIVLDKMENLAGSIDENTEKWDKVDREFDRLTTQFKRIGRVPGEKADEVWGRYKSAQDEYYDRKYKYDKEHQKHVDSCFSRKETLCEKAESLLEEKDLALAARKINRLHHKWKKIGNLPQRDEDKLWARFKAATDEFNQKKSNNIDKLREQEEENYQEKLELIERARDIQDTTDWEKGHSQMQDLLKQWKKIGPVPKGKGKKVWKKFKGAQDVFYDRRRDHFKEVKEQRKENLEEKKKILEKLKELGNHDDPIEAVEKAKPLQEKFKDAGYVPIEKKNEMWKRYREACDVIYDRFRAAKSGNKFDQELAKADLEPEQRAKIKDMRKKYKKMKKEMRKLEEEVLQFKESKTYFKPSGSDNSLIDEIQEKIDKAENRLEEKKDQLETLNDKIEEIKAEA